jgi:hypothetical protein
MSTCVTVEQPRCGRDVEEMSKMSKTSKMSKMSKTSKMSRMSKTSKMSIAFWKKAKLQACVRPVES